jgi:hypothetical protein
MSSGRNALCDLAIDKLAESGIDAKEALENGLFSVENVREDYHPEFKPLPGLIIRYFHPDGTLMTFERDGEPVPFVRVRYLRIPKGFSAKAAKRGRYSQHKGSGCRAYFPSAMDWSEVLSDVSNSLVIVEGELKALAACLAGYPTIGLGGVRNFVRKTEG